MGAVRHAADRERRRRGDVHSGMVLAKTKVAALQPTVCAAWLQAWMSMRYSVKCRSRDSTTRSRTTLSSKIWKSGLGSRPARLGAGGSAEEVLAGDVTATTSLRRFGVLQERGTRSSRDSGCLGCPPKLSRGGETLQACVVPTDLSPFLLMDVTFQGGLRQWEIG